MRAVKQETIDLLYNITSSSNIGLLRSVIYEIHTSISNTT